MMMSLRSTSPLEGEDSKSARDAVECLDALGEGFGTLVKCSKQTVALTPHQAHLANRLRLLGWAILSHEGRGGEEGCHVG